MKSVRSAIASLLPGVLAGLTGTAAMSTTMRMERQARKNVTRPVDFDATSHVITAASSVLHWTPTTDGQRRALFLVVHWGYGSATGMAYPVLRRATGRRPVGTALFFLACQTMAMTLFPTLGQTPPPWRWPCDILVSSLAQHAVYAMTVAAVYSCLAGERGSVAPH